MSDSAKLYAELALSKDDCAETFAVLALLYAASAWVLTKLALLKED